MSREYVTSLFDAIPDRTWYDVMANILSPERFLLPGATWNPLESNGHQMTLRQIVELAIAQGFSMVRWTVNNDNTFACTIDGLKLPFGDGCCTCGGPRCKGPWSLHHRGK